MLRLGTYVISGSFHVKPIEIKEKLTEYIKRDYTASGLKGLQKAQGKGYGYLMARNTPNLGLDFYTVYWYQKEPNVEAKAMFKINLNHTLEEIQ